MLDKSKAPEEIPAVDMVRPVYPPQAYSRGITGWVTVEYTIDTDGHACDIRVLNAKPPSVFNQSAIDAVRKREFAALSANGRPVAISGQVSRVSFDIED